jgi:hypothetical protein
MLIALQQNSIEKMLRSHGFKSWDNEVVSSMNEAFYNMIHHELKKYGMRRASNQQGGKIVMPLEYFGVESNNFVESAEGVSVAPTADYVRPPIGSTFQTAGAGSFISLKAVDMVVEDVASKYNKNVEKKRLVVKALKKTAEKKFTEILMKVKSKSKSEHMSVSSWNDVVSMKKYNSMH